MRSILHVDLNNFYASVECLLRPKYKDKALCVCGDADTRHGVVLAKNALAKSMGIKTGMVLWEARQLCKDLVAVNARFELYLKYSKKVKNIYRRYTDKIEPFGIDECWLDITDSLQLFGSAYNIAIKIKEAIKSEIGLTVSVGISYNKIYAKLGSDQAGRDGVFEITEENKEEKIFNLPVEDLLYVGKATKKKLNKINVFTIGDLAKTDLKILKTLLGKWGEYLYNFANGLDLSPVRNDNDLVPFKSIGNSLTNYKDIIDTNEIKSLIGLLSESIIYRARDYNLKTAKTLSVYVKDCLLNSVGYSCALNPNVLVCSNLEMQAYNLLKANYNFKEKIRAMGISVSGFDKNPMQFSFLYDCEKLEKQYRVEEVVNRLKKKYGNLVFQSSNVLKDERLKKIDIKKEHTIHPESYFK